MTEPYYRDEQVQLYLGDCRELLPTLDIAPDAAIVDPPYGETSLGWDRWPDGWPSLIPGSSMWCFGSMRMFLERRDEFAGWKLSQDVVWEKHNGSGFQVDRFKCVHELAVHWYREAWRDVRHEPPRERWTGPPNTGGGSAMLGSRQHTGAMADRRWFDDGTRITRSVIRSRSMQGRAIHPTEKPAAILTPLIEYAVPPGGLVLDPMAGSCSTAVAAKLTGRRAVCIEAHEPYVEAAARRLDQGVLDFDGSEAS